MGMGAEDINHQEGEKQKKRRKRQGEKTSETLNKKEPTLSDGLSLTRQVISSYTLEVHSRATVPASKDLPFPCKLQIPES